MTGFRHPAFACALVLSILLAAPSSIFPVAVGAQEATPVGNGTGEGAVLLFAAPGMRPDLIESFAAEGALPAIADLLENGAAADDGLLASFPATTGTNLPTLLSGAWPAEHGIVGDRFYRTGSPDFADFANWSDPGLFQADTLPQAVERAGKRVVSVGWEGISALDPGLSGPVVSGPTLYSQAGVVTNVDLLDEPATAERLGVGYDRVDLRQADGWSEAPESFSPAQETDFTIRSLDAAGPNPDREFALYIYDSTDDATENYDRVLVAPDKDAAAVADLATGAWAGVLAPLTGELDGQAAGFWLKAIDLAPDLSMFRLYYTPVSRIAASWLDCEDLDACAAPGGFAEAVNVAIGPPIGVDSAPLDAGLIDEATFVAQGITSSWQSVDALRFIAEDLAVQPDLLLLGTPFPEAASRQFLGLMAEDAEDGTATPVAATTGSGESADRMSALLGFVRDAYTMADEILAVGRELLGPEATTMAALPDGLAPSSMAVNAGKLLVDAGLAETEQPENCVPGAVSAPLGTPDPAALPVGPTVKACWSGGTVLLYINVDGREAAGTVAEDDYGAMRDAAIAAFTELQDPESESSLVGYWLKEDLRDVMNTDALHPSRSPDALVVLPPGYRFDDPVTGVAVAPVAPKAAGGYLIQVMPEPNRPEPGLFLADGPRIAPGATAFARAIDIAPTAAFLLGVPGPYNSSGSILYDLLANGPALREITLLDISDFHGQLTPLSASADDIDAEGAVSSSFDVGGVAYLAPWFDRYRTQARGKTLLVTAGDAVGATPPISSVFGDLPTIEAMNALGFSADSLGNHNFDAGAANMFETLAPVADFPYLSVNLVPARADATPVSGEPPFLPSLLLDLEGVSVGIIGFSNPDIPQLTRPGALGPYRVIDPVEPINAEAARLRDQGADVIIAMGHMGATGGTLAEPTGPVVDVSDRLEGVDVVVGDHTDVQVSAVRPNGTLLVENRSKGVMFTRVRLVMDIERGKLVYRTADYHRPWNIGITPDPDMTAALEQLEVELAPTLGRVIGSAVQPIPRADACAMETGRTCESLIGDVVADALRSTYGTDFAITNSGGIRADLTCPPEGGEFCPTDAGKLQITEGQVLTALPFGNVAVTVEISGAELKAMLEAGVAAMPAASGAFPQISGFCFTYDLDAEPGHRVTGAVRQSADGMCGGEVIDLSEVAMYTITTNDFTASGGDNYPSILNRASTRDILASVVSAYVAGESPLSLPGESLAPKIEVRIVCEGESCPAPAGG